MHAHKAQAAGGTVDRLLFLHAAPMQCMAPRKKPSETEMVFSPVVAVSPPSIQPAGSASPLTTLLVPLSLVLATVRLALIAVFALLWSGLALLLGPAGRGVLSIVHALFGRLVLGTIGLPWVNAEVVSVRNRGWVCCDTEHLSVLR